MPEQQTHLLAERYELIAPLGRGTMGTVWRARDRALGREVAVKEIRQDSGLTEEQRVELRERMVREGRIASRVNHPAVAAIHDVIVHGNRPWIIMELVEGRSLEQVIDEEGPLPPRLVAEIGVDLLGALRAAHAQGITHRDVKPANVLITETGRVVLTDFGIAKVEGDPKLTKTGMVIGSPGYTAPERARGEYTGPESDLWSLGATLYFAVEGRPAYERSTIAETLAALLSENADPPTQAGPLRPVLEGLLNKDHRRRLTPAQAETMLRMVADTPTSETPALPPEPPVEPPADQEPPVPPSVPPQGALVPPAGAFAPGGPPSGPHARPPVFPAPPYGAAPPPAARDTGPRPAAAAPYSGHGGGRTESGGELADSERTVSMMRPKTPLPQKPPQGPPPGQAGPQGPRRDEGDFATMRVPRNPENSPGLQVYPPAQQQQPPGRPPQGPGPQPGPPSGPQPQPFPGPQQPLPHTPQFEANDAPGLGTDLFSIAGMEQQKPNNRTGMLVLMAVAAGAAVVIAILVVALIMN